MKLLCKLLGHRIIIGDCMIATSDFNCVARKRYCKRKDYSDSEHVHDIRENSTNKKLDLKSKLSLAQQSTIAKREDMRQWKIK